MLWSAVAALFLIVVVLAGIAAIFYGYDSAWKHLASPP
jgi:preprotein translocase subunit SecE